MSRAGELSRHREELIARCESQRADIAYYTGGLATPIRIADRVAHLCGYLRKYPVVTAASAAFIAVTQRRGLLKWGQRALVVWRAWSALRSRRVI